MIKGRIGPQGYPPKEFIPRYGLGNVIPVPRRRYGLRGSLLLTRGRASYMWLQHRGCCTNKVYDLPWAPTASVHVNKNRVHRPRKGLNERPRDPLVAIVNEL